MKRSINLEMHRDEQCLAVFSKMFVTTNVDEKVELKIDVTKAAKNVLKKHKNSMDARMSLDRHNDVDLYTSKHMFSALKVMWQWRKWIHEGKLES